MRGKKWTEFTLDQGESGIVNGYIDGLTRNISTRQYVDSAVEYTAERLSALFEEAVDEIARGAGRQAFAHVYEWGDEYGDLSNVGNPAARLFKLVHMGKGKNRQVGFTFLPSIKPSPIEPELLEPGKSGKTVNEGVHVFTWKAPAMEYAWDITLRPKLPGVKVMAFVDPETGDLVFREGPIETVAGDRKHQGVFTTFFYSWWSNEAPNKFDDTIRKELESDVITDKSLKKVVQMATRRRRKDMSVSLVDFETGKKLAKKHADDNRVDYARRARRQRMKLYGY